MLEMWIVEQVFWFIYHMYCFYLIRNIRSLHRWTDVFFALLSPLFCHFISQFIHLYSVRLLKMFVAYFVIARISETECVWRIYFAEICWFVFIVVQSSAKWSLRIPSSQCNHHIEKSVSIAIVDVIAFCWYFFFCYVSYNAYFVFPYSLNEAFPLKIYFVVIFFAGVVVICRVSSRFLEKCIFVHYFQTVVAFTSQFCVQSQRVRYTTRR